MHNSKIEKIAHRLLAELPGFWAEFYGKQLDRILEEVSLAFKPGGTVLDLGGRPGFHAAICAAMGMRAICVDNYWTLGDESVWGDKKSEHDQALDTVKKEGVEFIHTDILSWEPPFPESTIDVVMSFQTMEHFHHSPRRVFTHLVHVLKPNGTFILSVPNAAKLANRLRVPFGKNVFSTMDRWYFRDYFDYHVREPVVADLMTIANDLQLTDCRVFGRNWAMYIRLPRWGQPLIRCVDHALRFRPSLCFDIYLLAKKPAAMANDRDALERLKPMRERHTATSVLTK